VRFYFGVVGLISFSLSGCVGMSVRTAMAQQQLFEESVARCESYGYERGSKKLSRCASHVYEARLAEEEAANARAIAEGKAAYKEYLSETNEPVAPPFGVECGPVRDGSFSCAGM
jgi:hypothetical protein